MKVYIVEDDFFNLEDLKITLEKIEAIVVGYSDDPFQVLIDTDKYKPDVILIDLHLNGKLQGIDLAKKIKELHQTPIIFITSEKREQVISSAGELKPIAYLTKPIRENDLRTALILSKQKKFESNASEQLKENDDIYVKQGNNLVKVIIKDILYAFVDTKNYCSIVTNTKTKYSIRISISKLKGILGTQDFVQTHRSYIVNMNCIRWITESDQSIQIHDHSIPISRGYKQEVFTRLRIL